jgi:hypothetical protein
MNCRKRWLGVLGVVLTAAALAIVLPGCGEDEAASGWDPELRISVRVIHADRAVDVELTEQPVVEGRVAYEGPEMTEGAENWKASHDYRGVELAGVVEWAVGLEGVETVTLVALDGWHKTLPGAVLDGTTPAGAAILALSVDEEPPTEWDDSPLLVFLPEDERFSNDDMLDALGPEYVHYFGNTPSTTGLMVKGVAFLVINYDGGPLPTLADL